MTGGDEARTTEQTARKGAAKPLVLAAVLATFTVSMVGAAYAAVPLYRMFCQVTGFGGTPKRVANAFTEETDVPIEVRFDTNVGGGLPWEFKSIERRVTLNVGQLKTVHFRIVNKGDRPTAGLASYNIVPPLMGSYFSKVECFCFNEQDLGPNESEDVAVTFYVDPAMFKDDEVKDARSLTLSYSFYPAKNDGASVVETGYEAGAAAPRVIN